MDGECLSTTNGRTLALLRRDVCGAYAIRPYTRIRKRGAVCVFQGMACPKGNLFFVYHRITHPGRDHFSTVRVGAYGIRPTGRHPWDGECLYMTKGRTLALLRRVVCGAYAFAPYTETRKRGAVRARHNRETIKRTAFHAFHRIECPKGAAVEACTDVGWGGRKNSQPRYVRKVHPAS